MPRPPHPRDEKSATPPTAQRLGKHAILATESTLIKAASPTLKRLHSARR
jgi:hypothetical protein